MEDELKKNKKNGRQPQKNKEMEDVLKKKWKTKINLIGCDTIVNSPRSSSHHKRILLLALYLYYNMQIQYTVFYKKFCIPQRAEISLFVC